MLEVRELQLQRAGFALSVAHWGLPPGEVRAALGANGAGKSTLLRCLAGEYRHGGAVLLHGRPLADWTPTARARHLAVLSQSSAMNFAFTAEEVVALGATPLALARRELRHQARAMMQMTDCAHLAAARFNQLSGGERQRVHLARVLLQLCQAEQAPVLLLDEPTSAQDLGQQHGLLSLVRELARERQYSVMAVLHDLNLALRYTDACVLLHRGAVVATGTPTQVVTAANVAQFWRYPASIIYRDNGAPVVV